MNSVFARIQSLQRTIAGSALIIGVASIVSRALGLLRDRILSAEFGAGSILDAYYTAFKMPDLFFNLLILGALSGTFVPLFIEKKQKQSEEEALHMASTVYTVLVVIMSAVALLGILCAPYGVHFFASGDTPEEQAYIVYCVRVMSVSLIFFTLSTIGSFLLNAYKRFFIYSLAPIAYNIGIIFAAVLLVPVWGANALPWGVVIGSCLHMCVQLPELYKIGFRYRFSWNIHDSALKKLIVQMPGRSLSLGVEQFAAALLFALASFTQDGARTAWQFADNLQNFPINIFGASLSLAAFPVFAEAFSSRNTQRFVDTFVENVRRILFFIIPIALLTVVFRAQIVRLVYGAGSFNWDDTVLTAQILGVFALSMFAQALTPLCTRAFFAEQKGRIPILLSIVTLVVSVGLAAVLVQPFGILGLAMAYSFASIVRLCILFIVFRVYHELPDAQLIRSTVRILIAAVPMIFIAQGMKYAIAPVVDMQTWIGVALQTVASVGGASVVYLLISWHFEFPEARAVFGKLQQWRRLLRL